MPAPNFEELPMDVLLQILDPVDIKKRFEIWKMSKRVRFVVDQIKTKYDEMTIDCDENTVSIFLQIGNSSCKAKWSEEKDGGNYMEIVLDFLKCILNPTKIRVEMLQLISNNFDHLKKVVELFLWISKTTNSKFHVKSASMKFQESALAPLILSVVKPRTCEVLDIGCYWNPSKEFINLEQIKDIDQFKQSKIVLLTDYGVLQLTELALLANFEEFSVQVQSMGPDDIIRLRDTLTNSVNFKRCAIKLRDQFENTDEIARVLGKPVPDWWIFNGKHSCAIADSDKLLHFSFQDKRLEVEKGDARAPDSDDSDDDWIFD